MTKLTNKEWPSIGEGKLRVTSKIPYHPPNELDVTFSDSKIHMTTNLLAA